MCGTPPSVCAGVRQARRYTQKAVHTQVCTAGLCTALPVAPVNNMTPAVATDRLLCVPPCVCTAFCVYRLACGPFNNMTPARRPQTAFCVHRLVCAPPSCVYRLACGPGNNMTPAVATDRLLCATALCVHRLQARCTHRRRWPHTPAVATPQGGPLNNTLLRWPQTAFCVHRLCVHRLLCVPPCLWPLNNMTPAVATDRLLCVPPCVCTAFSVYRLACGPMLIRGHARRYTLRWPQDRLLV